MRRLHSTLPSCTLVSFHGPPTPALHSCNKLISFLCFFLSLSSVFLMQMQASRNVYFISSLHKNSYMYYSLLFILTVSFHVSMWKTSSFSFISRSQCSIVWILVYIISPLLRDLTFLADMPPLLKRWAHTLSNICLQIIWSVVHPCKQV